MSIKRTVWIVMVVALLLQAAGSGDTRAASDGDCSRLGSPFLISQNTGGTQPNRRNAEAAYNSQRHEFLVVWTNQLAPNPSVIVGERISATGLPLGFLTIATGIGGDGKDRQSPVVAYNATNDEYVVVFEYKVTQDIDYDVRGVRVAGDGSWVGTEFEVFNWANRAFIDPRIAWNSYRDQFLVVATAMDTVTFLYNDVAGRRVMADGSTPYAGHNISAQSQVAQPNSPDVTYNVATDEYLVVWTQLATSVDADIWGARVRGDNDALVSGSPFEIDTISRDQSNPAVATNSQDRYLVVWEEIASGSTTDSNIMGQELDASGNKIYTLSFIISNSSEDEQFPDVAINGGNQERMVVWRQDNGTDYAVYQFAWFPDVVPVWMPWELKPYSELETSPEVVAAPPAFLTVYEQRDTTSYVWGRLYDKYNVYLPAITK